jgi:hypothetical protein
MALLPQPAGAEAAPLELLQGSTKAQLSRVLSSNCCCRCMREFKCRSALLRHLEAKLIDCPVAPDAGGVDVPRSALLDLARKRDYDSSRRCTGLAAVTKAVQQHRLMSAAADAHSFHVSALSTSHTLLNLAHHLLQEASGRVASRDAAAASCTVQQVADVMAALEDRIWELQLNPASSAGQAHPAAVAVSSSEHTCHGSAALISNACRLVQPAPDLPRHPCLAQHLADAVRSTADRQFMLMMALALAGRAANDVVDAGRLQAWLAIPAEGEGVDEAAGRAAQLMKLFHQYTTCQAPAGTLAAVVERLLVLARCLRSDPADGVVEVYCAGTNEACTAPGIWKAVSMVDAGDQVRWHSLLDSCAYQGLECMIDELNMAWHRGLQRLDVLRVGLDEYVSMYMKPWDVADMHDAQRAQWVRPSMSSAIQRIIRPHPDQAPGGHQLQPGSAFGLNK